MSHTPYRFYLSTGLSGCYLPDSGHTYEATTRRELVSIVRHELEYQEFPKSKIAEFNLRQLWRNVQRYKSGSSVHTYANHKGRTMSLSGLTDKEYKNNMAGND